MIPDILIVDDEKQICENIGKFLTRKGYTVDKAYNGKEALGAFNKKEFALVLCDIKMPVMNGLEALKRIRKNHPDTEVIMISAVEELDIAVSCMKEGAYSYLSKPISFEKLHYEIKRALERRELVIENLDYRKNLEIRVEEKSKEVKELLNRVEKSFYSSIRLLIELIELYDPFIGSHCKRVGILGGKVAEGFSMSGGVIQEIQTAGYLHDIGKLGIPVRKNTSPLETLNEKDITLIKKQTIYAQEILGSIDGLVRIGSIIRSHLERVDGTGFPDGLKGDEIPVESRILCVVNAYDEMRFRYRFSQPGTCRPDDKNALSHLKEFSGKRFDPEIVRRLEDILNVLKSSQKSKELLSLDQLRGGMTLAGDIVDNMGKTVFANGTMLSAVQVMKIQGLSEEIKTIKKQVYVYK